MTERDRRTLSIGGVGAVTLIAFWLALGPDQPAAGSETARADLLAEYRGVLAQASAIEEAWGRAQTAHAAMVRRLLPEANPVLAGAGLSRLISAMVQQSDVRLDRTALGAPQVLDDGLVQVSLAVDLSADIHGLREFLTRVERAPQALNITSLRISALDGPSSAVRPGGEPPLRVQLSVVAYALAPEAAGGGS